MSRRLPLTVLLLLSLVLAAATAGCIATPREGSPSPGATSSPPATPTTGASPGVVLPVPDAGAYRLLDQDTAWRILEEGLADKEPYLLLDVRTPEENEAKRIPGDVLLPLADLDADSAAGLVPGKDTVILVYCRSGNRSGQAARLLADLGYTRVYDIGGIITWPYDTASGPRPAG